MSTTPVSQQRRVDQPQPSEPQTAATQPPRAVESPRTWWTRALQVGRERLGLISLVGAGGFLLFLGASSLLGDFSNANSSLVFYTVRRGELPITVTERGNLESQQTIEITCEVESFGSDRSGNSGTQILSIVPNGASVKQGDLLVELSSADLQERLDVQYLDLQRAESEMIQARVQFENQKTQNETALQEAQLDLKLAELELQMYEDENGGTFQIDVQQLDMELREAQAKQLIQRTDLEAVETLYSLGYRNKGELAAARLSSLSAEQSMARLMSMRKKMVDYEYKMQKLVLEGAVRTAERAVTQVQRDNESQLAQAKAAKDNAERAYKKEEERYNRYKSQLDKCKIYAPQDGMVAYSIENSRYSRGSVIEEGAFVRERQKILALPDLKKMQVTTAVHESVLDQVEPGLPATIRLDAFSDKAYPGSVKSVAVLPDPGGYTSSDTKVYKTVVVIDDEVDQIKPGMTAVVEIHIARLEDVISVPVQAIVQVGTENWCYVESGRSIEKRRLKLGRTNDKFVEIRDGLEEGDRIVLNPMAIVDEAKEKQAAAQQGSAAAGSPQAGAEPGDESGNQSASPKRGSGPPQKGRDQSGRGPGGRGTTKQRTPANSP